ncbi:YggS family pyridoxal phosphate-dependent enzyme [Catenuloplanes atrovinosus]|uniref:Pyridoxal phosphate homeostasis protein n=1 Tax=Catenuloplanes atrovinosus TaxID=137266 RepID=A0AAE4CBL4_9ACTN|nr:YggS family pyridoxal phosphate-dependent enzyme [Catenuloplanes atrovinosus]MDR7278157.1 pyridoxal phosphate enzyme (YggS family) [Catenuloplanes atrovinosus]
MTDARRDEIAGNLAAVRARIGAACAAAGRDPAGVTLIAVTKTYPASDVEHLAALGVTDVGENRDQEAAPKAAAVTAPVRWHYIGQLQRNKARSVAGYAHAVHSVDSVRLAEALGTAAARLRDTPIEVLVQVSLDGREHRGGAFGADVDRVADAVAARPELTLRGVMAVAPQDWEPAAAFARLAEIAARMRAAHPGAELVSAGMSGDLEAAIAHGATHVRVGGALLGMRAPLR